MATSTAARLAPGMRLRQRYLIQEVQRQTRLSCTYLALDQERSNRPCLLTEFPIQTREASVQEALLQAFRQAATPLFQLQHPQLPHFSAAFRYKRSLFLVQSHTEGVSYRALLQARQKRGKALTEPEVLHCLTQIIPVLSELHRRGIFHCKLSPDTILLPIEPPRSLDEVHRVLKHEAPLMVGLGAIEQLAQQLLQLQHPERSLDFPPIGQAGYAPPEQLHTGRLFPHSDLYALGVTALVLLTGRDPQDLLDSQTLSWCWQPYVTLSPEFEAVLLRLLAWKPGDRYPHADAALKEIQKAAHHANLQTLLMFKKPSQRRSRLPIPLQQASAESLFPRVAQPGFKPRISPGIKPWELTIGIGVSATAAIAGALFLTAPLGSFQALTTDRLSWMQVMVEHTFGSRQQPSSPHLAQSPGFFQHRRGQTAAKGSSSASSPAPQLDFADPMIASPDAFMPSSQSTSFSLVSSVEDIPVPIYFSADSHSQTLSGTLYELPSQSYLVVAQPGQRLAVRVEGLDATVTVLDSQGQVINSAAEATQRWAGALPGNQTPEQTKNVAGGPVGNNSGEDWARDRYFIRVSGSGEYQLSVRLQPLKSR